MSRKMYLPETVALYEDRPPRSDMESLASSGSVVTGMVDDWPLVMVAVMGSTLTVCLSHTAYRVMSPLTLRESTVVVDVSDVDHPLKTYAPEEYFASGREAKVSSVMLSVQVL